MNKIIILLMVVFSVSLVSGANYWVGDPVNCPSSDGTNFPGQNCAPDDIFGDSGGTAQCYDTSLLNAPAGNATSTTDQDSSTCQDGTCNGGYIANCYATADGSEPFADNSGAYWCDRNSTIYGTLFRNTVCVGTDSGGTFGTNSPGTCRTNYFQCDGGDSLDDCEILAGLSCGSGTGTIVYNQCFSSSAGNCTRSSDFLDCNDGDGDSNQLTCNPGSPNDGCEINPGTTTNNSQSTYVTCTTFTCNSGYLDLDGDGTGGDTENGCEIQIGGSCTAGSLSGTYDDSGVCVVPKKSFATGNFTEYATNSSEHFLWGKDYGLGALINFSDVNNNTFIVGQGANVTLGNRITFALGNILESITSTLLKITGNLNVSGNITSSYYFGDGSQLTNLPSSDNSSWNESYANTLYISQSDEGNLNVNYSLLSNSSDYWDELNTTNSTQFENNGGILNILESWLTTFINSFGFLDDDVYIDDSELPLANRTLPYCGNITGATSDLCTLVDTDTDTNYWAIQNGYLTNDTTSGVNTTNLILDGLLTFTGDRTIATTNAGDDLTINPQSHLYLGTANSDSITIGRTTGAVPIVVQGGTQINVRDSNTYINSPVSGELHLNSTTNITIESPLTVINGNISRTNSTGGAVMNEYYNGTCWIKTFGSSSMVWC
jgi:hypothetical protein